MYDIELNNGVKMPVLGLGIYKMTDEGEMKDAVQHALAAGYRSFDTAQMYGNEGMLGNVLEKTDISRENLFLTSKVDTGNMGYEKTRASFTRSLEELKTDYLDLFLVHWPGQKKQRLLDTWSAMEELYFQGKIRAIGVCNCQIRHLEWILENSRVTPAVNQVERNPLMNDEELFLWCREKGIQMEAWRPLLKGNVDLPEIAELAGKYGKTPAQILLRWEIQSGYIVIPKSVHQERIFENADIFDFELDETDMSQLSSMNTGKHSSHDPESYDF